MTESDKEDNQNFASETSDLASMILHGTEFISEGLSHRQVILAMMLAVYRYADLQRECCCPEGPAMVCGEMLAMIVNADKA